MGYNFPVKNNIWSPYFYAQVAEDSAELSVGGIKFPYPYSDQPIVQKEENKTMVSREERQKKKTSIPNVPEYRVVHRGHIDLQNFTNARL